MARIGYVNSLWVLVGICAVFLPVGTFGMDRCVYARERETGREEKQQRGKHMARERQRGMRTDVERGRQSGRQTDRQTDRERHGGQKESDRQTETDRERGREGDTHTERERAVLLCAVRFVLLDQRDRGGTHVKINVTGSTRETHAAPHTRSIDTAGASSYVARHQRSLHIYAYTYMYIHIPPPTSSVSKGMRGQWSND